MLWEEDLQIRVERVKRDKNEGLIWTIQTTVKTFKMDICSHLQLKQGKVCMIG